MYLFLPLVAIRTHTFYSLFCILEIDVDYFLITDPDLLSHDTAAPRCSGFGYYIVSWSTFELNSCAGSSRGGVILSVVGDLRCLVPLGMLPVGYTAQHGYNSSSGTKPSYKPSFCLCNIYANLYLREQQTIFI